MRVVITRRIHERAEEILRDAGMDVFVNPHDHTMTPEQLAAAVQDADGVICMLSDRISKELLETAVRPRVFANYAAGFDNMDVLHATKYGVALCNTPDVLTGATSEIAWALLFAAARFVCVGDRMVRAGEFQGWGPLLLLGHEVCGRTLGIIGAGRIGCAMARRARGFDMRVLYTNRVDENSEMREIGGCRVNLDELLRESDFISIHAPLTADTYHMIGAEQLAMMKPTCVLINTGRGPIIDEKALAKALRDGVIAAAGLDVYEREPVVEPELLTLDNVVLLPHIGSATFDARESMAEVAALNVLDSLTGRVPRTCINPEYIRHARPHH